MKNKGFTLIELLAVIVILAVIALIATPLIMGTITKAKRNAMKDTAYGILKAGEQYAGEKLLLAENNYAGETIALPNQDKINYKGGNGVTGELQISKEGKLAIQIHNNQFCAIKNFGEDEVTVTNYGDETCKLNDTPESVSFATDSWDKIAEHVKNGEGNLYHVGDTKEIELSGAYAGTYTVRLANTSTPAECAGTDFSQTACGFVVEFYDIITTSPINYTAMNDGGWPGSELYKKLNSKSGDTTNSVIYNALPEDLKQVIVDTKVISSHGPNDSTNFTSTDKLYLLSTKEVYGKEGTNSIGFDSSDNQTRQLDYYKSIGVTTDNYSGAKKQYQGSNDGWWLRSAPTYNSKNFCGVTSEGYWPTFDTRNHFGVAPTFRIG